MGRRARPEFCSLRQKPRPWRLFELESAKIAKNPQKMLFFAVAKDEKPAMEITDRIIDSI